jgi:hypothetical protein
MSISRNYYVIAGYDLTGMKTDKFDDWKWTDEGEKYTCNQIKGKIQFFDDPMSGSHLYFGYILAGGDMYEYETSKFKVSDVSKVHDEVRCKLANMINIGLIKPKFILEYQIIAFEECT